MECFASRINWSTRIFPEIIGDCHPPAQEHTGSHRQSAGTYQGSRTTTEDLGSVIHLAKTTWVEDQLAQINVLLARSQIPRIQNQSRRSLARNRSIEGHSTSERCCRSQLISGAVYFFRSHVRNFAQLTAPLTELTRGEPAWVCLVLPSHKITEVLGNNHGTLCMGHEGVDKTKVPLSQLGHCSRGNQNWFRAEQQRNQIALQPAKCFSLQNYWWPNMNSKISDFIKTCDKCQKNRTDVHSKPV